jgi:hypothetical protein
MKTATLTVEEYRPITNSYALTNLSEDDISSFSVRK